MKDDDGHRVMAQAPLAGVIMCCTSIAPEQRSALASIAAQMGADHKYDLTSDVTHLIVGNVDTPKYKYVAKERPDVKVVTPAFIEAVRLSWMEGGDTDVAALEVEYKVPTFFGLRICVTGFEDLSQRQKISETVTKQGAEYHGDLTKAVTHLIAASPKGKKYEYARQWGIRLVSLEWFSDSIERGMVLDESLYDPLLPPEERGKGAWNRMAVEPVSLGKRSRQVERLLDAADANRRKLRRTASAKLGSQSGSIWADITRGAVDTKPDTEWQDTEDLTAQGERRTSVRNLSRTGGSIGSKVLGVGANGTSALIQEKGRGLFEGRIVYVHGFNRQKTSILRDHLASNSARVLSDPKDLEGCEPVELDQGFVVVPHDVPYAKMPATPSTAERLFTVTEWWVETCLTRKTLIDPAHHLVDMADDVLCRPFTRLGIEGFEGMVIGSTGFNSIDLLHVSKVVNLMGAKYDEYLKPSTSLLICSSASPNPEKLSYTLENNIPAVTASWLWGCLQMGEKLPVKDYLIKSLDEPVEKGLDPTRRGVATTNLASESRTAPSKAPVRDPQQILDKIDLGRSILKERRQDSPPAMAEPPAQPKQDRHTDRIDSFDGPADGREPNNKPARNRSSSHAPDESSESNPQPLQELVHDVNSPKKPSRPTPAHSPEAEPTSADATSIPRETTTAPPGAPPSVSPSENLHDSIAALLAHKQASSRPPSAPQSTRQRRRRGPLGRAPSMNSNNSRSLSCASSIDNTNTHSNNNNESSEQQQQEGTAESVLGGAAEPQPSQALIYEDPDVQAQRERMVGVSKGKGAEARAAVKRIGIVRDVGDDEETGVAGRVRRRGRGNVG